MLANSYSFISNFTYMCTSLGRLMHAMEGTVVILSQAQTNHTNLPFGLKTGLLSKYTFVALSTIIQQYYSLVLHNMVNTTRHGHVDTFNLKSTSN